MPLGKYYCDYCDKQFQDTAAARRRHLIGLQHQRAKSLWYSPQNLNRIHEPHSADTGVCYRFVRTGLCKYGDSCKFVHPYKDLLNPKFQGMNIVTNVKPQITQGNLLEVKGVIGNQLGTSLGNLPPSLWPPPDGGYPPLPFIDWG